MSNAGKIYVGRGVVGSKFRLFSDEKLAVKIATVEKEAIADRLAVCWNAFEGIDDPLKFMQDFKTNIDKINDELARALEKLKNDNS